MPAPLLLSIPCKNRKSDAASSFLGILRKDFRASCNYSPISINSYNLLSYTWYIDFIEDLDFRITYEYFI